MYVCQFFKGRKFEIIVFTTYFDIFQLKTLANADIINDLSKFLVFLCSSGKFAQANFKLVIVSHFSHIYSYHTQLTIVLALAILISYQC